MRSLSIPAAFGVIDRFRKIGRDEFFSEMSETGIDNEHTDLLYSMISRTVEPGKIRDVTGGFASPSVDSEISRLQYIGDLVSRMILSPVKVDLSIVRGLAYYTGVVFEAYDVMGKHRAILGGGRYDRLAALMSDQDIPAVGFGMGDAVIELLTADKVPECCSSGPLFPFPYYDCIITFFPCGISELCGESPV